MILDAVRELLTCEGFDDLRVDSRRTGGSQLGVVYSLENLEVERRQRLGAHSIRDMDLLAALSPLPVNVQIPIPFINQVWLPALFTADPAFVDVSDEGFTRLARRPCSILALTVRARDWTRASAVLSDVSALGPCVVEVEDPIGIEPHAILHGFGVYRDGELRSMPMSRRRVDKLRVWTSCESIFERASGYHTQ